MNKKIFLPIFVIAALLFFGCGVNIDVNVDKGSGNVITETRDVSDFDRVILTGMGDLTVTQGDSERLEIEAEDNVIPHITTKVSGGILEIGFDRKTIIPTEAVKFNLTMRNVRGLETKGVSNIQSSGITTDQLNIVISGTGNINLRNLNAGKLTVTVSGAGNFNAEGKADEQKITMSGAGNYNGEDLESKVSEISISGLGRATLWVTDQFDATISGTGGIDYYGSPQVSQKISGLGSIKHMGNK